jgi:hypothetical protein
VVINDCDEQRTMARPPGMPVDHARVRREILPSQLQRASIRHGLVEEFANMLYQAFGLRRAQVMFQTGWLFGSDGLPRGLSLRVATSGILAGPGSGDESMRVD